MNRHKTWQTLPLGEVAELIGGGTPRRSHKEFFGDDIPWVTPSDLPAIGKVGHLGKVAEGLTFKGLNNSSAKRLPAGTVLFSSRASIGKIAVADRECCTNQGFANFVPDLNRLDTWFLAYLLCRFTPEITDLAGSTTFKEISRRKLKSFRVPIPPLSEQRRIVARIKECMERIEEVEKLRTEALDETSAIFASGLSAMITVLGSKHPDLSIGELATETRYGTSRSCTPNGDGTPILRIPNVINGKVNFDNLKYCQLDKRESTKLLLKNSDLLLVRTNGSPEFVGRTAVFHAENQAFGYASYLIRVRFDQSIVVPDYVSLFLASSLGRKQIAEYRKTSAGQYNINSTNLKLIRLPVPSIADQKKMVKSAMGLKRVTQEVLQNKINQTRDFQKTKASVLRGAFAGEL